MGNRVAASGEFALSPQEPRQHPPQPAYIDEGLVIKSLLNALEAEERQYKLRQMQINYGMALFTFLLVVTSCISDFILIRQNAATKQSANAAESAANTAAGQLEQMKNAAVQTEKLIAEAQKQNTMTRQQLVGSQAARIQLGIFPTRNGLSVSFDNRGIINGRAKVFFTAQRMTIPEETPILELIRGTFSTIVPPDSKGGIPAMQEYRLPGYTPETFDSLRQDQTNYQGRGRL